MAEFPAVSPLLDGFSVGECLSSRNGVSCYALRHDASGQEFILKHISVPESEAKVQALLLSGAYASAEDADEYYKRVADSYCEEFSVSKSFAECPNILHFLAHQSVKKEAGTGYDIYAVTDKAVSLSSYMADNALTKLGAINLGIDLCAALCALRNAGYLHQNVKPENVFIDNERFMLGDLGLVPLQDMKYSSLPEQYIGPFTAPELHDVMSGQNPTTDLYAVGMLLYRLYNGDHAPFEDERVTSKEAEHMRLTGKELPVPMYADYELAEILLKACAFKQEDRYQSPAEMKQALELYMKRNGVADALIVPPIINDPDPELPADAEEALDAPVRFADVEQMDDDFIKHFAPDTAALEATIEQLKQDDAKEAAKAKAESAPQELPEEQTIVLPAMQPERPSADESNETKEAADADAAKEVTDEADSENAGDASQDAPADEEGSPGLQLIEDAHSDNGPSSDLLPELEPSDKTGKKSKHKHKHKKRSPLRIILSCVLLLLVAAAFVYFFTPLGQKIYHYTINIEEYVVSDATADSITVQVNANVEQPPIKLTCKDAYGNRFDAELLEQTACFTGLESGTQYTITAEIKEDSGPHRLRGTTSVSATTLPSTEILSMAVSPAPAEGVVMIDLVVKDGDPEPSSWTVSYCYEGGTAEERTFDGEDRRLVIHDLEVGKEYTFTLLGSELSKLVGTTSAVYTPEKEVTAESLTMVSYVDGALTVSWECTSDAPETWTVICTDPDGNELSAETTECTATVEGLTLGTPYSVKLSAKGLFVPPTLELPDTLIHIDRFEATADDDGLHVFWGTSGADAGDGWYLISTICGDDATASAYESDKAGIVLTDLLPDTEYSFSLKANNENPIVGHAELSYRTPKADNFDSRGMKPTNTALTTHAVPEDTEKAWKAKDLKETKKEFDVSDKIAFKLTAPTGRYQGSFSLLYIFRDENGKPVDFGTAQHVWNEVWAWDDGANFSMSGVIDTPTKNGTYTLEVYFSYDLEGYIRYQLVSTSAPLTVSGAPEE